METSLFWFTAYFQNLGANLVISSIFLSIFSFSLIIGMFVKKALLNQSNIRIVSFYSSIISLIFLLLIFLIDIIYIKIIFIFIFGINIAGFLTIALSIGTGANKTNSGVLIGLITGAGYLGPLIFQSLVGYFSNYSSKSFVIYLDLILIFILCIINCIFLIKKESF